eukprot:6210707-Pleurochrysis_carterae.AAC.2
MSYGTVALTNSVNSSFLAAYITTKLVRAHVQSLRGEQGRGEVEIRVRPRLSHQCCRHTRQQRSAQMRGCACARVLLAWAITKIFKPAWQHAACKGRLHLPSHSSRAPGCGSHARSRSDAGAAHAHTWSMPSRVHMSCADFRMCQAAARYIY